MGTPSNVKQTNPTRVFFDKRNASHERTSFAAMTLGEAEGVLEVWFAHGDSILVWAAWLGLDVEAIACETALRFLVTYLGKFVECPKRLLRKIARNLVYDALKKPRHLSLGNSDFAAESKAPINWPEEIEHEEWVVRQILAVASPGESHILMIVRAEDYDYARAGLRLLRENGNLNPTTKEERQTAKKIKMYLYRLGKRLTKIGLHPYLLHNAYSTTTAEMVKVSENVRKNRRKRFKSL